MEIDNTVVTVRGKMDWGGRQRRAKYGGMGTERDFVWGNGHMMQCADDVLLSCTLKTCLIL